MENTQNKPKDRLFIPGRGAFMVWVHCGPGLESLAINIWCIQRKFAQKKKSQNKPDENFKKFNTIKISFFKQL